VPGLAESLLGLAQQHERPAEVADVGVGVGHVGVVSNAQLLGEIGLSEAAQSTLLKLLAEHIRQRILIDPVWWWRDAQAPPFWERLQQAVYEDRYIETVYEHYGGEVVERVLEAYSLVAKSSIWYLIAAHDGELRTYRVSRFKQVALLDRHYRRRDDFDLPTYWQAHLQEFVESLAEYRFSLRIHPDRLGFVRWLAPKRSFSRLAASPQSSLARPHR